MTSFIKSQVIAKVYNERKNPEDDNWGNIISDIQLNDELFSTDALIGIDEFSHLEIIYFMHLVVPEKIITGSRRPRNLQHLPEVGIFAQRPKARPNRLGLSRCELLEVNGFTLNVKGLDAINNTPVIDIKPYFNEFSPRGKIFEPKWVSEIMKDYY